MRPWRRLERVKVDLTRVNDSRMNYIELVNRFWELDEGWQFSCCETRLYFYLLRTANRLGWESNWTHGDSKTAACVGVSINKFKAARDRIANAGLISFKRGGKGFGDKCRYQILTSKIEPKIEPNYEPKLEPNLDPIIIKPNQTKPKKKSEKRIFSPPVQQEVVEYFTVEKKIDVNDAMYFAERFINFYLSKNWMVGKNKMTNWKSAATRSLEWEDRRKRYGKQQESIEQGKQSLVNRIKQASAGDKVFP